MESWVRYSVAVYVGLLLAGALIESRDDPRWIGPDRTQLSQMQQQLELLKPPPQQRRPTHRHVDG